MGKIGDITSYLRDDFRTFRVEILETAENWPQHSFPKELRNRTVLMQKFFQRKMFIDLKPF